MEMLLVALIIPPVKSWIAFSQQAAFRVGGLATDANCYLRKAYPVQKITSSGILKHILPVDSFSQACKRQLMQQHKKKTLMNEANWRSSESGQTV